MFFTREGLLFALMGYFVFLAWFSGEIGLIETPTLFRDDLIAEPTKVDVDMGGVSFFGIELISVPEPVQDAFGLAFGVVAFLWDVITAIFEIVTVLPFAISAEVPGWFGLLFIMFPAFLLWIMAASFILSRVPFFGSSGS